jgi:hypothetical protein
MHIITKISTNLKKIKVLATGIADFFDSEGAVSVPKTIHITCICLYDMSL